MIEIILTSGSVTVIQASQLALVEGYRWRMGANGYAVVKVGKKLIYMHRLLAGATDGVCVDHRNGNRLDNRSENLRLCTHAENMRNRKVSKSNKLGIKGVSLDRNTGRYRSEIRAAGKRFRLGTFETADDARRAYISAAQLHHGEFANFG